MHFFCSVVDFLVWRDVTWDPVLVNKTGSWIRVLAGVWKAGKG